MCTASVSARNALPLDNQLYMLVSAVSDLLHCLFLKISEISEHQIGRYIKIERLFSPTIVILRFWLQRSVLTVEVHLMILG